MVTTTKMIWESASVSLNQLAFQEVKSPKDTLTKTGTENETKAENKSLKWKKKWETQGVFR